MLIRIGPIPNYIMGIMAPQPIGQTQFCEPVHHCTEHPNIKITCLNNNKIIWIISLVHKIMMIENESFEVFIEISWKVFFDKPLTKYDTTCICLCHMIMCSIVSMKSEMNNNHKLNMNLNNVITNIQIYTWMYVLWKLCLID